MRKRLIKHELVETLKSRAAEKRPDLAKADVEAITDMLWETLRKEIANGTVVPILGFWIFEPKESAAKSGRNGQSGEAIQIAASRSVRFKLAASFKAQLNK